MTSREEWNYIVEDHNALFNKKEEEIDTRWRQYCSTFFGYQPLFNEIVTQPSIHVGVHDHAIPDIVLCFNGKTVFDIELKQYCLPFSIKFEEQLISYLKLQTLSSGMIVCREIYLYSYDILSGRIKKVRISFTPDNPKGVRLIELLKKESFNADDIRRFAEETSDDSETGKSISVLPFKPSSPGESVYQFVSTAIKKWCKQMDKQGKICFLENMGKDAYSRFTTEKMDHIITSQPEGEKGPYGGGFYAYEIRNTKAAGTVKIMLAFGSKNASPVTKEQFQRVFDFYGSYPPDGWQWRIVDHSETVHYTDKTTEKELFDILDLLYDQIIQKEAVLFEGLIRVQ